MLPGLTWLFTLASIFGVRTVVGHGFVKEVTVDGTVYPGFDPNLDLYQDPIPQRVIRQIPNDGPVTDITIADLTCNRLGERGTTAVAEVSPGGRIKWQWNQWLADHLGPVWTYMASCGGDCANLDLSLDKGGRDLKWFKIDAKGYDPSSKRWASQDVIDAGDSWTSMVPKDLKAGQYLVRHEIVALHSNPAQFYPACLQVTVTGAGSSYPDDSNTVTIPGLFDGFIWPDIWAESFSFTIPGPPVISFDGSTDTSSTWSTPDTSHVTATIGIVGTGVSAATPTDDWDGYGGTTTAKGASVTTKKPGVTAFPDSTKTTGSQRNVHCAIRKSDDQSLALKRRSEFSHSKSRFSIGHLLSWSKG